jgi:hypothetical protein
MIDSSDAAPRRVPVRPRRAAGRPRDRLRMSVTLLAAAVLPACGDSSAASTGDGGAGGQQCIKPSLSLDCTATFPATYDAIYDGVLGPTCAANSACHMGPADKAGNGLVLSNRDDAYEYLLGTKDGRARVIPGNPECSILEQRLESDDVNFRMPKLGDKLDIGDRCPIRQWIHDGAKRK